MSGYGVDANITWLLDQREVYVALTSNPDGRTLVEMGLGDEPVHAFRRVGVELSDGNDFGPLGAGHVRVNLATSLPILEQTVAAMATVRPLG